MASPSPFLGVNFDDAGIAEILKRIVGERASGAANDGERTSMHNAPGPPAASANGMDLGEIAIRYDHEKHSHLASALLRQEPSKVAQGLLQRGELPNADAEHQAVAAAVLAENPSFDISKDRVKSLAAVEGLGHQTKAALEALQRIQNLATDPETTTKLIKAGFTSAAQIAAMPASKFSQALPGIPQEVTARVHANATGIANRNEMFLASVAPSAVAETLPILKALSANATADGAAETAVNLDTLFGSSVNTSCSDCNSIFSPAAYLVDLLDYLPDGARDEILRRRPDIKALELSCANTNTEIPYLDLANEVMEAFLAQSSSPVDPVAYNNHDQDGSGELAAEPRNVSSAAYDSLSKMVSPLGLLPFDRNLEQTRILLEKLGTSKEEVLTTFGTWGPVRDVQSTRAITAEILGLPVSEYVALAGESFSPGDTILGEKRAHEYWGFSTQRQMLSDVSGLCRVQSQFLPRTGYGWDDLVKLLQSRFVRGGDIPEFLLQAGLSMSAMWQLVDWSKEDQSDAKWADLVSALNVKPADGPVATVALARSLKRMANMPVIVPVPTQMPARGDATRQPYRRWPLTGRVYYGSTTSSTPIGYLDETGYVRSSTDGSSPVVAYFDADGVFRKQASEGDWANDPPAYSDPAWDADSFYVQTPSVAVVMAAELLREVEDGPEGRSVQTNGEMKILQSSADFLAQGPASTSSVAGWCWEPLPGEGEPAADLMTIRTMSGQPLSVEQWRRINRFVRLQRRLGWSIAETDDALSALGTDTIDAGVLQKLGTVKLLRRLSGLSLANTLVLVGDMGKSLYAALFVKSSVLSSAPEGSRFALSSYTGDPVFVLPGEEASPRLVDHAATVGAALGLWPTEVALILNALGLQSEPLTLSSLSHLFRHALLCRALGQPTGELRGLLLAFGEDPFQDGETTVLFLRFWKQLLSRYTLAPSQWAYIATGVDHTGGYKPSMPVVLQTALAITIAHDGKMDPETHQPSRGAGATAVDNTRSILSAIFHRVPADIVSLLFSDASLINLVAVPAAQQLPRAPLFTGFFVPPATGDYEISEVQSRRTNPTTLDDSVSVPAATLSSAPPLVLGATLSLVGGQFYRIQARHPDSTFMMKYKDATSAVPVPASCLISMHSFRNVEAAMLLLSRYDVLLGGLGIPAADVEHLLNFVRLPAGPAGWTHDKIRELVAYDAFRDVATSAASLSALLPLTTLDSQDSAVAEIVGITGWDEDLVASLVPGLRIGGSTSAWTVDISTLDRLHSAYELCRKMGVHDAAQVFRWATPGASSAESATQVRALARSQVDQAAWEASAAALFDPLRKASRDALIAGCVEALPEVRDAGGLFEYFLIDVSMGTCLKTSRIKQAISSIQIFVQRCLLGVEDTPGSAFDLAAWAWKKSYDTWQANRKVLLYPENWLEPSLRDDKSEVFAAVEAAMDQGVVSSADVIAKYVAGMLKVADLEPVALHSGPGRDHVFARTRMAPHQFFYCWYDRAAFVWSPWESVQIDIPTIQAVRTFRQTPDVRGTAIDKFLRGWSQSDVSRAMRNNPNKPIASGSYLAPVVLGNNDDRLVVFLPTLTQRSYSFKTSDTRALAAGEADASYTKCYWEVGMAFSERKEGKWTPRQLAPEVIAARDPTGQASHGPAMYPKPRLPDGNADDALLDQPGFFFLPKVESEGTVSVAAYAARYRFIIVPDAVDKFPYDQLDPLYSNALAIGGKEIFIKMLLGDAALKDALSQLGVSSDHLFDYSLMAHFLGEFVLEGEHIHLRPRTPSDSAGDGRDGVVDRYTESQDWLFQAAVGALGPAGRDGEKRTLREMDSLASYSGLVSVETLPKKPRTANSHQGWTDEEWALLQQWDKQTAVRPTVTIRGTLLPAALSNNFAADLHSLVLSKGPQAVFDYFRDRPWPRSYRIDGQALQNPTTVADQGLGLWDRSFSQYHELGTPISLYNWELCVHIPMLLASTLLGQQRFDDALEAVKFVFDPTIPDGTTQPAGLADHRMWRFLPFRQLANQNGLRPADFAAGEVAEWEKHPFDPFAITRKRHTAVMKWFAYKYIEAMIGKGDAYFRRFTLESISLAIQCYIEAAHLYGPKPQTIASVGRKDRLSVETMLTAEPQWDSLDNVLVNMETLFPFRNEASAASPATPPKANVFGTATAKYFCVPANPALTRLRATIDDRLYKIRHCQDIDGNVRALALWEPPLDPGALVRAVANGTPLSSVLDNSSGAALPNYRFANLMHNAFEVCAEVRALGGHILSLRERKDSELLSGLHVQQQRAAAKLVLSLRAKELEEAQKLLEVQQNQRTGAVARMKYYLGLLGEDDSVIPAEGGTFSSIPYSYGNPSKDSGLPLSKYETTEVELSRAGLLVHTLSSLYELMGGVVALIPDETVEAAPMGVGASVEFGGKQLSTAMAFAASAGRTAAEMLNWGSANASRFANFQRQTQERQLMANLAGQEITNIDMSIDAQRIRIDQAQARLAMDQQELQRNEEMDAFLRSKYSNQELYTWSISNLQKLYYATYNIALDFASQAEAAFRFERGLSLGEREFVQGGYWNSSYDGLYAGEQLNMALFRLQQAHATARPHDFELTRSVSLRQINPRALVSLRNNGTTGTFSLPEVLWDMDFPGHYNRRVASVSVSVPCIIGPYTALNATLRLAAHSFRVSQDAKADGTDYRRTGSSDARFRSSSVPIPYTAISTAQNDAGVFELSFKDERYMPFEGAGVISDWTLDLGGVAPQFAYSTISDVVLHIRYTAQQGSTDLTSAARANARRYISEAATSTLALFSDLRAEFATAWAGFRATGRLVLQGLQQRLPYFARTGTASVLSVGLAVEMAAGSNNATRQLALTVETTTEENGPIFSLTKVPDVKTMSQDNKGFQVSWPPGAPAEDWVFAVVPLSGGADVVAVAREIIAAQLIVAYRLDVVGVEKKQ